MASNNITVTNSTVTPEEKEQHCRNAAAAIINKVAARRAMYAQAIMKDNFSAEILTEFAADETVEHDTDFTAHLAYELSFVKVAIQISVEKLPRPAKKEGSSEAQLQGATLLESQPSLRIAHEDSVEYEAFAESEAETREELEIEKSKSARTGDMSLLELIRETRKEVEKAKQRCIIQLAMQKHREYLAEQW